MNLNKNNRIVLWISLFMTLAPAGSVILAQTQNSNPVTEIVSLLQKPARPERSAVSLRGRRHDCPERVQARPLRTRGDFQSVI